MRVLGIDPGLSGGLAIVKAGPHSNSLIGAIDIPVAGEDAKKRIDVSVIVRWLQEYEPDVAYIERAQAMPDQGASSGFHYGRAVGYLEATCLAMFIPLHIIEVRAWKKLFQLPGKLNGGAEMARQRVIQMFPDKAHLFARKKDHGRAEAALIAAYGTGLVAGFGGGGLALLA